MITPLLREERALGAESDSGSPQISDRFRVVQRADSFTGDASVPLFKRSVFDAVVRRDVRLRRDRRKNVTAAPEETASAKIPGWKRVLDCTLILLSLPCWLPVMILLVLWIKLASPGPVFFRQERVGYRKKLFQILKFRSMKVNSETRTHENHVEALMRSDRPMTKLDTLGDSRVIPGGRLVRALGLDELPQIFNVLRGEMSLVGPRPCTRQEFEKYETWQQDRAAAPPGLTGYWQVNGKNQTTFSQMISMDLYYAANMSVLLDLGIILKTVPAVIAQASASRAKRCGAWFTKVSSEESVAAPDAA